MQQLMNFAFEENLVRVVDREGEPWFAGKDVCAALGITKYHQALEALDEDERGTCIIGTPRGDQSMIVISEPGVYRLVFRSRKPAAERFKRWLAHDVIPQVRKTGSFGVTQQPVVTSSPPLPAPVDETARKMAMVTEARMTHGPAYAARLWRELGLPEPGKRPAPDADALACLAHLLAAPLAEKTVGALIAEAFDGDKAATTALKQLKIEIKGDGFTVPNVHPAFTALFKGAPWRRPFEHLRRLPGVKPHLPYGGRFAGEYSFIPSTYLPD